MKKRLFGLLSVILMIVMLFTGCSKAVAKGNSTTAATDTTVTNSSQADTSTASTDTATAENGTLESGATDEVTTETFDHSESGTVSATTLTTSDIVVDREFSAGDLEVGYEATTATQITLNRNAIVVSGDGVTSDGAIVTIHKEGCYVVTGTLENGQIIIDAGDSDKVRLVLNGVAITCNNSAPIYVKNADKVFITLKDGSSNTLTDGTTYIQEDENTVDGVIFSMSDLTLNGTGTLTISANYKHGIVSKDDLVITGGTYTIHAVQDTLNGKDNVKIKDGTFALSSTDGDGIQSKNDEDTTKGYVYISGGTIVIGECIEGIEGTAILVEGGDIDITSSDDGLNAASTTSEADTVSSATTIDPSDRKAPGNAPTDGNGRVFERPQGDGFGGGGNDAFVNDENCYIEISGGTLHINALGDGIDSNGSINISGGSTYVSGPTENNNGSLDYNGTAEITGGIVVAAGSSGMAQSFSDTSSQCSILQNLTNVAEGGSEITLTDTEGKVIITFAPEKTYQSVVISTPELVQGNTYKLSSGTQINDITLSSISTSNGQQSIGGMPGRGGNRGKGF